MGECRLRDALTLLGLQRVVGSGSAARAALRAAVHPVDVAVAFVAAALALEGAEPGHRARLLHVGHVVDGDAAVEAGADRLKYQLDGSRGETGREKRRKESDGAVSSSVQEDAEKLLLTST